MVLMVHKIWDDAVCTSRDRMVKKVVIIVLCW